jgi:hypothetical protein
VHPNTVKTTAETFLFQSVSIHACKHSKQSSVTSHESRHHNNNVSPRICQNPSGNCVVCLIHLVFHANGPFPFPSETFRQSEPTCSGRRNNAFPHVIQALYIASFIRFRIQFLHQPTDASSLAYQPNNVLFVTTIVITKFRITDHGITIACIA